ncbi:MAG: glycosyltransferase family 39 protein [Pseudomonadota bacterium]|nr:glycosyltransferase family 39 protein [Pseudomonadota bacterium]
MKGFPHPDPRPGGEGDKAPSAGIFTVTVWLWVVLAFITLWRLTVAWAMPATQDEAYYFDWARSLAWGYFDHPPGVALLGVGTLLAPASTLAARLVTLIAATLTLVVLVRFYRDCGLKDQRVLLLALVLAFATLPGLAGGVITTPDTVLALCWAVALHEALPALRGERRRWLTAGLATGIGLLGKYTMVLIGPVFLWALLWTDPRALRSPWPYLGGLLAILAFAPNILWNADNDWLTMRFQFGHGFSTETGELVASALPAPITEATASEPEQSPSTPERIGAVLGYLGTQAAFWGLILLPAVAAVLRRRDRQTLRRDLAATLDRQAGTLLAAATFFPLLLFGLIAGFSEVEPNWPGMYLISAAPLVAIVLERLWKWALAAAAGNLLLVSLYAFHGATGALPLPASHERILRETHGYAELAEKAAELEGIVFADRYQIAAMLRFYQPDLPVTQWPGITRPSEYLRGSVAEPITLGDIEQAGGFWLITRNSLPPTLPGFHAHSGTVLYDCKGMSLKPTKGSGASEEAPPCDKPLHVWRLYRYRVKKNATRTPHSAHRRES